MQTTLEANCANSVNSLEQRLSNCIPWSLDYLLSMLRPAQSPPTMYLSAVLFIALTTATLLVIRTESRSHYCIPCDEEECEIEPQGCRYGIVRNNCNRKVCAKVYKQVCIKVCNQAYSRVCIQIYNSCVAHFGGRMVQGITLAVDQSGDDLSIVGPGERCGGPSIIWGRCGDGMHCMCNVCDGCDSEFFDCHTVADCVPPSRLIERY
uniref:Neuroparsin n=1 Tax=Timema shepardi TaxID=629360 RepID=A0A7R9AUY1_TIMSH|nr:unnamed protein product [Timema shepardi]